ncbi:hypothetical protein HHI36_000093 [Cryptolaemus montrouzieri]|uniref:Chemosensory protein n=1 Tax=Cryptolaemus montrouzieri TaxID=559131 RepID=A0ABD2P4A6_9CUCU
MSSLIYIIVIFITVFVDISYSGVPINRNVRETETYSTKYDDVDVDAILASARLLKNYVNCLLDKGGCTPEGKLLKEYLPDALLTDCSKCSKRQKQIAGTVFSYLLQNHKDYWNQLLEKYDKDGTFRKRHESFEKGEAEDYSDLDEAKK